MILINLAPVSITPGPWLSDPPLLERAGDAVMAYGATLGRIFWPDALAIVHPTPVQMGLAAPGAFKVGIVVVALLAVTGLAAAGAQRRGYLIVGWLWFLGMLFPLVGLIPSGLRVMHDRYAYVPIIGIAIVMSFGASDLQSRWRRSRLPLIVAAGLVLLGSALVTSSQVGVWKNSLSLFDHTLAVTERNAIVNFYRGNTLVVAGDLEGGRAAFETALEIYPDYPEALQNLGHLQLRLGRPGLAVALIQRALEGRPHWTDARTNLGRAQWASGDRVRGLATLMSAVEEAPGSVYARSFLASAYHEGGQLRKAVEGYEEALRLDPGDELSREGLARIRRLRR
jgi:tetratricopeptide (TPR) repeat protein